MAQFPARLHVLLSSGASTAVVIRRGPSSSVCTVLWDRASDEFTLGQWMRGRIYERRSDLSPDGKHLIYFAMNGQRDSETKGAWTAISRAPYLKAITLLAKGDCWHGGGLFTGDRSCWLNDGYGHTVLRNSAEVRRDTNFEPTRNFGGECPGVYYPRLLRDGWALIRAENRGKWKSVTIFEKPVPGGSATQENRTRGSWGAPGSCYWDEHELSHAETRTAIDGSKWEWAEFDRGRLVWATEGKLYAGYLRKGAIQDESVLHDFNAMTFEAVAAPYQECAPVQGVRLPLTGLSSWAHDLTRGLSPTHPPRALTAR